MWRADNPGKPVFTRKVLAGDWQTKPRRESHTVIGAATGGQDARGLPGLLKEVPLNQLRLLAC